MGNQYGKTVGKEERALASLPRSDDAREFEICFFAEPGSLLRVKGVRRIFQILRQVTFRCGMCAQPVLEEDMPKHTAEHEHALGL